MPRPNSVGIGPSATPEPFGPRNRDQSVAAFTEEEGARFGVACLGSKLAAGAISPSAARELRDADGVSLAEAMTEVNGRIVWGALKSHESRSAPIPRILIDDIAVHCAGKDPDELVFTTLGGAPLRNRNFTTAATFLPDGTSLLTVGGDRTAQLWLVPSGQALGPALVHQGILTHAACSADGRLLATAQANGSNPPRLESQQC